MFILIVIHQVTNGIAVNQLLGCQRGVVVLLIAGTLAILHGELPGLDLINFFLGFLPRVNVLLGPVYVTFRVCNLLSVRKG